MGGATSARAWRVKRNHLLHIGPRAGLQVTLGAVLISASLWACRRALHRPAHLDHTSPRHHTRLSRVQPGQCHQSSHT